MTSIVLELDDYEARALVSAAGCVMALLGDELDKRVPLPDGYTVFPLESAQLKIETAMVAGGVDP